MVGLFSKLSVGRSIHRRTQSAIDEREALPQSEVTVTVATVASSAYAPSHRTEVAVEFKPAEYPVKPLENDQPIQCPLPEPSILNDGRIWKERMSASMLRSADLPMVKEGSALESENVAVKPRRIQSRRGILPSISAPEHDILKLLEECNASGI